MLVLVRLARPKHWVKNGFVAAPLLFVRPEPFEQAVALSAVAVAAFSLAASAIYCFNDVLDAESDRAHPTKRLRPVAAGQVSPGLAVAWGALLAAASLALAWWKLPKAFLLVLGAYALNNVLYNAHIKRLQIVDVIAIAVGFVLRLVAGAIAIGAVASSWLLVCSFSLAMFLGFGKRRSELGLAETGHVYRPVLKTYTPAMLDSMMAITAALTLMCYMLYTIAPETQQVHHTANLVYTVPPVFYGMFRFIFKVQEARGASPEELLLSDPLMLGTGAAWAGLVVVVLNFL